MAKTQNTDLILCGADKHLMYGLVLLTVEEEDVFQCGKCKRKFSYLSQFLGHKQNQCVVAMQTSDTTHSAAANASGHTAGLTNANVIYTAQLAHAQSSKQIAVMC